jgi:SNF2 family DNA or RNA helicase
MIYHPRPYQVRAQDFLVQKPRANLHMQMGLGKTSVVLTVFDILRSFGEVRKMLVLGPVRVARSTWSDEVAKWDHLRHLDVAVAAGESAASRRKALASDAPIHAINYENVSWLLREVGPSWPYDIVVADESTRVKNHAAVRFRGKPKRQEEVNGELVTRPAEPGLKHFAGRTKRWINLSGAPAPKGLHDLWSQQYLLDGGLRLGKNITAFRDRWFREDRFKHSYTPLPHAMEEITAAIRDCTLALKSADYLDLPELITTRIDVDLPEEVRAFYDELEQEFVANLGDTEVVAWNAAVLTGKLRQVTSGAVYQEDGKNWTEIHDAKIEALASIVEEQSGAPLLVAYTFKHDLERIKRAFPFARHLDKNAKTIRDWNAGRIPMLLVHPSSAGPGLNLQDGGNAIAFFSPDWDLDGHDQVIERIGPTRQLQSGHPRPVFVYYIAARDTVDELVLERLVDRRTVQDIFMEKLK